MTDTTSRPRIDFDVVALDTADPRGLADFYCTLLGWEVTEADDDWVTLSGNGGARLAFQLAPDHVPPTWPSGPVPQQVHLDLRVDDLTAAAAYAESVGARRVPDAEQPGDFIVFLDPSGHPFCLCGA